jgi:hypothetical protein
MHRCHVIAALLGILTLGTITSIAAGPRGTPRSSS